MTRAKPKALESNVEGKYVTHVRADGALTRKLNGLGYRSWPDQWTVPTSGVDFMIEFKREGVDATELQKDLHKELRKRKKLVYVCDNLVDALRIYEWHAAGNKAKWVQR